ncbi:regulator of G-protein signaling 10 isoform X2 [Oenanthe melanoleuca]|uniref:regulator of G-protein signaling 10 isoform X2 n=1 Tax=Oenanthe melanoleuca TaxID=2939378 RepID=UPI0024C2003F|nr:regulator of G-protein signaling 10 isoform X2 [Oenanthe melanoleuca]
MEKINDGEGHPSSSHQTLKGTSKWATSLESLLEDPEGVKRFREFLKKEFSEENVLFWLACEEFKKTQGKKQMQEKAKEIYMTFLSSKASSQVNVEGQSRLSETILETPHPLMFQKLQDQLSRSYLGNPAFNQIFQDLERGKNCSPRVNNFPRRGSLPHCLGRSGGCSKGHQSCSPGFRDKPLQEYFRERLQELGSSQRCSREEPEPAPGCPRVPQEQLLVLLVGHCPEGQQPCSPAHQLSNRGTQCQPQKDIQNALRLCTGDSLDLLTMHIAAPLEVFVQKK